MDDGNAISSRQGRLEREIGRGAYGTVYLAVGPSGERAAVKVCRREDVGEERYERELRGAKLYKAIPPQEGLVRMRNLVEETWGFYTVMDLADDEFGGSQESSASYRPKTLARVIEGEKALPLKECVVLALSLANGLAALQRHHLLHRDIKPGNVLYVGGRPVLSDPGLVVEESESGSLVGTPGFPPPEGFIAASSDIYSLGLTLKAASFGRQIEDLDKGPAMEADTSAALFPVWWRILNKATDPTPYRRYQSAKALIKDLKTLRWKMSMPVAKGAWLLYAVLGIVTVLAVVYAYVASQERNRIAILEDMLAKREKMECDGFNEIKREGQWITVEAGASLGDVYNSVIGSRIDQVSATNEILAAELQASLDKIMSLDKKYEALQDEIRSLHDAASTNRKKGLSDEKEFARANGLAKERHKVSEEMRSIYEELCNRLGVGK